MFEITEDFCFSSGHLKVADINSSIQVTHDEFEIKQRTTFYIHGQIKHVVIYPFTGGWMLSMKVLITGRPYTVHMIYVV